jgi:DNA-binding transcriptional regulator YiaG
MSTKLSFKGALDRPDEIAVAPRVSSDFPVYNLALFAHGPIEQPVDFIRLIVKHGLSLKKARQTLDRLATDSPVVVELRTDDLNQLLASLNRHGVAAFVLENPNVNVKAVREKQGLSQYEFALLYGLEIDTLRNWEQGRNVPDGPAKVLLSIIDRCPHAVIDARTRVSMRIAPLRACRVECLYTWNEFFGRAKTEYQITYGFPFVRDIRQINVE